MKNTIFALLSFLLFQSCGHKPVTSASASAPIEEQKPVKTAKIIGKTKAIFHIIEPLGIDLILTNLADKRDEIVHVDTTLSQLEMEPGHWQLSGFIIGKKSYRILNTAQKFVFRLKKDKVTYVGSYIFQCPKVNQSYFSELKKFKFFNRYPFKTNTSLCEMVAGNNYKSVNKVWLEIDKQHRSLSLGF